MANIKVIDPAGFLDMISLESNAKLIMTDSGGVQKEAYFHRVPCVTLRDETEWVETVDAGWNVLAREIQSDRIISNVKGLLEQKRETSTISEYGDGKAAGIIAKIISDCLNKA